MSRRSEGDKDKTEYDLVKDCFGRFNEWRKMQTGGSLTTLFRPKSQYQQDIEALFEPEDSTNPASLFGCLQVFFANPDIKRNSSILFRRIFVEFHRKYGNYVFETMKRNGLSFTPSDERVKHKWLELFSEQCIDYVRLNGIDSINSQEELLVIYSGYLNTLMTPFRYRRGNGGQLWGGRKGDEVYEKFDTRGLIIYPRPRSPAKPLVQEDMQRDMKEALTYYRAMKRPDGSGLSMMQFLTYELKLIKKVPVEDFQSDDLVKQMKVHGKDYLQAYIIFKERKAASHNNLALLDKFVELGGLKPDANASASRLSKAAHGMPAEYIAGFIEFITENGISLDIAQGNRLLSVIRELSKDDIMISINELQAMVDEYNNQSERNNIFKPGKWLAIRGIELNDELKDQLERDPERKLISTLAFSSGYRDQGPQELVSRGDDLCARMTSLLHLKREGVDIGPDSTAWQRMFDPLHASNHYLSFECCGRAAQILEEKYDIRDAMGNVMEFAVGVKHRHFLFAVACKMMKENGVDLNARESDMCYEKIANLLLTAGDDNKAPSLRAQNRVKVSSEFKEECAKVGLRP